MERISARRLASTLPLGQVRADHPPPYTNVVRLPECLDGARRQDRRTPVIRPAL